eukprot:5301237-Amphidinium_carterae.2
MSASQGALLVEIKADLLVDICIALEELCSRNVVAVRPLRRLLGKLSHVASLVPTLRPFLQPLWASLSTANVHRAPHDCVWLRQIAHSVDWLRCFFADVGSLLRRRFTVEQHFGLSGDILICSDACPLGLGAFIAIDGRIQEWYSLAVTPELCHILGCEFGTSSSQQALEALAIL